jgi:hypothetical protein
MAPDRPHLRWAAKVGASAAFCLAGAVAGAGLYFGNLAYVRGRDEVPPSQFPASAVVGMSGGCSPFQVFAQNRWEPYGTAIRAQPNVLTTLVGSFPGNMSIAVNGWVYGRAAYPTNTPPWNSNVWYHLADGAGWVSFAGVRAAPSAEDPTGSSKYGGVPAPISNSCEGTVHW